MARKILVVPANTSEGYVEKKMPYLINPTSNDLRAFAQTVRAKHPNLRNELLRGTKHKGKTYWWDSYYCTHSMFAFLMDIQDGPLTRQDLQLKHVPRNKGKIGTKQG